MDCRPPRETARIARIDPVAEEVGPVRRAVAEELVAIGQNESVTGGTALYLAAMIDRAEHYTTHGIVAASRELRAAMNDAKGKALAASDSLDSPRQHWRDRSKKK